MSKLHLTLACGHYEHTRPLMDGTVQPEGVELTVLALPSPQRHWRMNQFLEFDVCELSMAEYLTSRVQGKAFRAIPVFLHRRFRHSYIFVNTQAGIRQPTELNGKRVGLRTYQVTAGLWARGILQEHYGVDLRSIHWFTQDPEDVAWEPPTWLHLERLPQGKTVDGMLERGELDAAIYPETPDAIKRGSPTVARLFPDYKAEEMAYYRKTGIFPIMHTVVIKDAVLEAHPWVALSLLEAFQRAKELHLRRLQDPRTMALAWVMDLLEEQRQLLGPDPWPYNLPENRAALETMIRYAVDQGLLDRPLPVEALFVPSTVAEVPRLRYGG